MKFSINKALLLAVFVGSFLPSLAQVNAKDYAKVDEFVKKVGSLDTMNMGNISEAVTKNFPDKIDKIRAIYDWITNNISFDCAMARSNRDDKNSPTEVLLSRKAVGIGFASLFQDMCSSANIRCLTVDGFVKRHIDDIGESDAEVNHSWAVVQLGQSPEDWYYFDPAWGAGYTDPDMKKFTKAFNPSYFFADKVVFNLQHYPDNEAWKLGAAPKNKKDFYALPIVNSEAYDVSLGKMTPATGHLKTSAEKPQSFSFTMKPGATIDKLSLLIIKNKKPQVKDLPVSFNNGVLSFSFKFDEGDYPVTVMVNDKELVTYHVEAD
ncbi:MAG TPA: transglutaminase domain-containing protein [Ferruginibacter sp.]|nr:transglutaminase domain-containing protein [Ferruginibacter sp.]